MVGNIGIDRRDPDFIPLLVMNQVFGGDAGGRLFVNLREERAYTYGVSTTFAQATPATLAIRWRSSNASAFRPSDPLTKCRTSNLNSRTLKFDLSPSCKN